MQKRVVIAGAGIGGLIAATALRRSMPDNSEILLVDRLAGHLFPPSLLWLMQGIRKPHQIQRPLQKLNRRGIQYIQAEIEAIDPANCSIRLDGRELGGDYLILAPGLRTEAGRLADVHRSFDLYSISGAMAIRDSLAAFNGKRIIVMTAEASYRCPAAPYEAALLIRNMLRARTDVEIDFFAAEPQPMGVAGAEVGAAVVALLKQKGISYYPQTQLRVDEHGRLLSPDGMTQEADLVVFIPPHRPVEAVAAAGLIAENGGISVDRRSLQTKMKNVYALGDAVAIPLANGKLLPKAGVFAHTQAKVVAHHITKHVRGQSPEQYFDGHGQCFLETGNRRAAYASGNFYAEPDPAVRLRKPSYLARLGKLLFEQYWLRTQI